MSREQLAEDMWYAVMTEEDTIRLTTKSYKIACGVAIDTDTIALLQKVSNISKTIDKPE
jgi:uncharacterized protein YhbP (UPF0306 family)